MRKAQINVYNYSDLLKPENSTIKDNVLEKLHDINVAYNWWDCETDFYNSVLNTLNGEGSKEFYFDLGRANYLSFDWSISCKELLSLDISKLKNELGKYYLDLITTYQERIRQEDSRVLKLIDSELCEASGGIRIGNRTENYTWSFDLDDYDSKCNYHKNIEDILERIAMIMEEFVQELNSSFLDCLHKEYEYRLSEEAILEAIEANEYEFTADGDIF